MQHDTDGVAPGKASCYTRRYAARCPPLRGGGRRPGESAFQSISAAAGKHKKRSHHHQKFLHNPIVFEPPQKYYKKTSRNPIKIRQNQSKTIRKAPFFAVSTTFALPPPK
jgi:hypothetical protein